MEKAPKTIHNNKFIELTYTNTNVRGCIISQKIKNHTIILSLDDDSRTSSPTHNSDEILNIGMVCDCIGNYDIHYLKTSVAVDSNEPYNWN